MERWVTAVMQAVKCELQTRFYYCTHRVQQQPSSYAVPCSWLGYDHHTLSLWAALSLLVVLAPMPAARGHACHPFCLLHPSLAAPRRRRPGGCV